MKLDRLHLFIGAVVISGAGFSVLQDWHALVVLPTHHLAALVVLVLLSLFSEALSMKLEVGDKSSGSTSIIFIPVLVGLLLFGPAAALLLMLTAGAIAEIAIRRKPTLKVFFNLGQWALACGLGGVVFRRLNGATLLDDTVTSRLLLVPFAAYALTFVTVNNLSVAAVISISKRLPLKTVVRQVTSGSNVLYSFLVSPVAFAIAVLYVPLHVTGLLLAFLPISFIRHSYLINLRLHQSNKDLLKALVKAIETRDPYTSGHSLRVASLARDIAEAMMLPHRQVADIETAALLHDIGKIDSSYERILLKPTDLSPTERSVIESHVTKGVELLRSLSSFPDSVLLAIRHHHEREDGRGYPDRIRGDEIPLGAKIIKVCDAIDAMLSDRPYRKALPLPAVRDQLLQYVGIQFDERVTRIVVSGAVLERHAAEVALHLGRAPLPVNESRSSGQERTVRTVGTKGYLSIADHPG